MMLKYRKLYVAILCAIAAASAAEDQPCAGSISDGATDKLIVPEKFGADIQNNAREVASTLQEMYGNNVAYDGHGSGTLYLVVTSRTFGFSAISTMTVLYDGSVSLEKAILDNYGIDTDKPDPNPCKNVNGDSDTATNTSSGGGGGYIGPMPSISIPEPYIADQVATWHYNNPSGSVTVSQAPGSASSFDYSSYYASYYSNYYSNYNANYYANYNPN